MHWFQYACSRIVAASLTVSVSICMRYVDIMIILSELIVKEILNFSTMHNATAIFGELCTQEVMHSIQTVSVLVLWDSSKPAIVWAAQQSSVRFVPKGEMPGHGRTPAHIHHIEVHFSKPNDSCLCVSGVANKNSDLIWNIYPSVIPDLLCTKFSLLLTDR